MHQTSETTLNPIYIGDFNVTMDPAVDRKGEKTNNKKSCTILHEACTEYLLSDVWRSRNEGVRRYSYTRKKPTIAASRIDFALTSQGINSKISSCFYIPCSLTDHSCMFVALAFSKQQRGRGFWKFNNKLLQDVEFVEAMNTPLDTKIKQLNEDQHDEKSAWELLKFQVANFTQEWSREKASDSRFVTNYLYDKLNELEENLNNSFNEKDLDIIERTKQDLKDIEMEKAKATLFRCQAQWQVEGERNTAYYFGLEKAKYNAKTFSSLLQDNGSIIRNPKKILQCQRSFYKSLYTKDKNVRFTPPKIQGPRLSEAQRELLELPFTEHELKTALFQMKNGKTPGSDGLSVDFYKTFYPKIKDILFKCIQKGLTDGILHSSARRGIINLIPKANKDTRKLQNARPIALLNVDLKILEKATANRILTVIDELIHCNQKGFLKGRRISSNIRKLLEVIRAAKQSGEEGVIISVDFMKCFDRISLDCVYGTLKYFGFGECFINIIKTTYQGITACVQNNGHFSEPFDVTRGVRQGAPNSSYIFLLCAEIMAIML